MGLSIGSIAEKVIATAADEVGGDFKGEVAKAAADGGKPAEGGNLNFEGPPPPMLVAKDWGGDEAVFCNRTSDENIFVFKDTYDKDGNPNGVNGTAVPPGSCGQGDFVLADFNGDEKLTLNRQNEEFIKQPNSVLGGFWNVKEGSDGKAFLEAGNNPAIEELMIGTQIHGRDLYTPKNIFEMNVLMGPDKKVTIEGTPWRQLGEAPITPKK